jgi:hypothetical protein
VMNTIPSTSKRLQTPYTVVGGEKIDKKRRRPLNLSLLLLNRGGKIYRQDLFTELERIGIEEIISIEGPGSSYDIEQLSGRYPRIKFIILHSMASVGEQINIGIEETHSTLVLVIWNDITLPSSALSSRFIERMLGNNVLCTVPLMQNQKMQTIPTLQVPAFHKKRLKVVALPPKSDGMMTLFPFDYVGIYDKQKFTYSGGFDHNLIHPYWQKMDFGFRVYMWGETIKYNSGFRVSYEEDPPVEDTTPDDSYKTFFLKNLSVRFRGDTGDLPFSAFVRYLFKSGSPLIQAYREFKEAKRWVTLNRFRFKEDARSVTDLWEVPEL